MGHPLLEKSSIAPVTLLHNVAFLQLQAQFQAEEDSPMAAPSPGSLQGNTPATPLLGWHQPQVSLELLSMLAPLSWLLERPQRLHVRHPAATARDGCLLGGKCLTHHNKVTQVGRWFLMQLGLERQEPCAAAAAFFLCACRWHLPLSSQRLQRLSLATYQVITASLHYLQGRHASAPGLGMVHCCPAWSAALPGPHASAALQSLQACPD